MSQVKFSGPYSQDSGSKCRKFQVPGTQFKVLGAKVPGLRVPGSRFSGSQGSRSHGPWYRFSGPDFRLCHSAEQLETGDFCFDNQFLLKRSVVLLLSEQLSFLCVIGLSSIVYKYLQQMHDLESNK